MFTEKLLLRVRSASSITVLTGAGISAESGVPTFRGNDGLWQNKRFEELAHIDSFNRNPKEFWEFYAWRRDKLKDIKPNLGHFALVDIERHVDELLIKALEFDLEGLHKKIQEIVPSYRLDLQTLSYSEIEEKN